MVSSLFPMHGRELLSFNKFYTAGGLYSEILQLGCDPFSARIVAFTKFNELLSCSEIATVLVDMSLVIKVIFKRYGMFARKLNRKLYNAPSARKH